MTILQLSISSRPFAISFETLLRYTFINSRIDSVPEAPAFSLHK